MTKMHYFNNNFSKMPSTEGGEPYQPSITWNCVIWPIAFFKLIVTKWNFKISVIIWFHFS